MKVSDSFSPEVVRLRSPQLEVDVAPRIGGRIIRIRNLDSDQEFLWNNPNMPLALQSAGSPYDPNFYGGIDELLPNDIPETIDGVECPDHGELWTTPLEWHMEDDALIVMGRLPRCGLSYYRRITLRHDAPLVDLHYRIVNESEAARHFLWKLHAAMPVSPGDIIDCPARKAQVVDLAYSRFDRLCPFSWPEIDGQRVDIVPAKNNTVDFFFLYKLTEGRVAWTRPPQHSKFEYRFDMSVFPFVWLFASYGGFEGHYTVILEPCTTMPLSVNDAISNGRCSRLAVGEILETDVSIYAGPCE